jgi:hypothetical protein
MGEIRNTCKILVVMPEWKRPLGILSLILHNNIKVDLVEMVLECVD